jgi:hypothetical protein
MKNFIKSSFVFATLALACFCASAFSENCPEKHSMGWCIAEFSGISQGLRESSKEDLAGFIASIPQKAAPQNGVEVDSLIHAGLDFAKVGYTPGLLSPAGWGAFWVLNSFGNYKLANQPHMFLILPESEVVDGNPRATAEKAWIEGVKEFLHATDYTLEENLNVAKNGNQTIVRKYRLTGGECGEEGCSADARFMATIPFESKDTDKARFAKVIDNPPSWIANEKVYLWDFTRSPWPQVTRNSDNPKVSLIPPEKAMEFMTKMSKWFYLYMPGKVQTLVTNDKAMFIAK